MTYQRKHLLVFCFVVLSIVAGCAPQQWKPQPVCPGKKSAAEALSVLRLQAQTMVSFRANGQCLLEYYVEGKGHKENFPVRLWVNPVRNPRQQGTDFRLLPSNGAEVYLQGEVAFDPRGLVLGSNEKEFWLLVKPDEISSYWWGLWSQEDYNEMLMISPRIVLEAIGIISIDGYRSSGKDWFLTKEKNIDILTKYSSEGQVIRKIYINSCDYRIRKIEHFIDGIIVAVAELGNYKEIQKGVFVPGSIRITNLSGPNRGDGVRITLGSIRAAEFPEKVRSRLFTRPQPKGFKHIYKVVGGRIIEQR
jgi:hypothetical protein